MQSTTYWMEMHFEMMMTQFHFYSQVILIFSLPSEKQQSIARFLALVTTMVTKVDHGNYGWLPRLVTMVSYLGYQGANYGY